MTFKNRHQISNNGALARRVVASATIILLLPISALGRSTACPRPLKMNDAKAAVTYMKCRQDLEKRCSKNERLPECGGLKNEPQKPRECFIAQDGVYRCPPELVHFKGGTVGKTPTFTPTKPEEPLDDAPTPKKQKPGEAAASPAPGLQN